MIARRSRPIAAASLGLFLVMLHAGAARAHPMVENALDVVIKPDRIIIEARISQEQVLMVEAGPATRPAAAEWPGTLRKHASYVKDHLIVRADGRVLIADSVEQMNPKETASVPGGSPGSALVPYRLQYPFLSPPGTIQIDQNFLREFNAWSASCVLRIRQVNDAAFDAALLTRERTAEFDCLWPAGTTRPVTETSNNSVPTTVKIWPTVRAYAAHGIMHILTGYDHLLFISALVLAAESLWDLVKVVSAFTLAHTLTLTLSVFNIVSLSERVVEPMIAASIVFVAVQNIFWPERSRGWTRLAIAFGFGLFHGLGFAGGLKEAMSGMPSVALWAALPAFSLGVEIGHQIVVVPLFVLIRAIRQRKAQPGRLVTLMRTRQIGSAGICVAAVYFLFESLN